MKLKKIRSFASKRNLVLLFALIIAAACGAVYASKLFSSHIQSTPFRSYEPAETITVDSDFQGEVVFNNRLGEKPFTEEALGELKRHAAGKGLVISRLSQTQVLVSTQP